LAYSAVENLHAGETFNSAPDVQIAVNFMDFTRLSCPS
jgi:hypothetical protein